VALNVSNLFDVIEHCKNIYANDPMSLLPYLTLFLSLSIASSYREKIRILYTNGVARLFTQACSNLGHLQRRLLIP